MPYAFLHPVARVEWTNWSIHWSTVVGLAALGALYFYAARRSPTPPFAGRRAAFTAGLLAIFVSLNGPLHDLSDSFLFSAHMVQHLVLTLLASPLLLWGTDPWMLRRIIALPGLERVARVITRPAVCFAIFNVVVAVWHLPALYDAAVVHHPVHILQHLMFMAAAVLMWWPYLSRLPEFPRLGYAGQMLYSFLMTIPMSLISVYIVYSEEVLYPAYAAAPRFWGLTPLQDQLLGGLIMWIPGGLFFLAVMSVVFFRWAAAEGDPRDFGRPAAAAQRN